MSLTQRRLIAAVPWLIVCVPAAYQLVLLATAIAGRINYPFDLEWMEGGMLHHAMRIRDGQGIYVPPSIDFIPYLYTPLYPALLAMMSGFTGISYTVGRAVSVLSLIGIALNAFFHINSRRHEHAEWAPGLAGALIGMALFASAYPFTEGWYDLVRADTFFLWIVTASLAGLTRWVKVGEGWRGHARIAAAAAMLALGFFAKQTGIFYVALGGLVVLVTAPRRVITYIAASGVIGLGGVALLQARTDGWFWIYIRKIHQAHDFNHDRFVKSFANILWHVPAMAVVIGVTLLALVATRIAKKRLPKGTHPFMLWTATYAVSTVVGAIGWGTEFAHYNAYMPAFLHGGLAAGAALPALAAIAREWCTTRDGDVATERPYTNLIAHVVAFAAASALSLACWSARWDPQKFIPTQADIDAGTRLVTRLRELPGDVWMPSHPWYLALAGKSPHVHRMGIKDVTWRQNRTVAKLDAALTNHAFTAIVLDDRDLQSELPKLGQTYRAAFKLPRDEQPRVYTGAQVHPDTIWVPALPREAPQGAHIAFDFENQSWDATWKVTGGAWGSHPATEAHPSQGIVVGTTGHSFANSAMAGDSSEGHLTTPDFLIEGKVTVHIGGTTDPKLRVELWVEDKIIATARVPALAGDELRPVTLDPGANVNSMGRLVFVDDSPTGHMEVDDVWVWPAPK